MSRVIPKTQHYVPRFLLKRFAVNTNAKKAKVWVFDKSVGKPFGNPTSVDNVAAENGFYNFENDGSLATLEFSLADFEGLASTVLTKLVEERDVSVLTPQERGGVAYFVAVQFVRTRSFRENLSHMQREFAKQMTEVFGANPFPDAPDPDRSARAISLKRCQLQLILCHMSLTSAGICWRHRTIIRS